MPYNPNLYMHYQQGFTQPVQTMELHGIEAVKLATWMLGRPVCVSGFCAG
jgi:hypothetical protein